jgi:lysophospholipase L1-like esterase
VSKRSTTTPWWATVSLLCNGVLLALVVWLALREQQLAIAPQANASAPQPQAEVAQTVASSEFVPELGPRHQLSYDQWVELLRQEAQVVAAQNPERLGILAGDSISLWFPAELLPDERIWLNQGISGETTTGLLERLDLFDETEPEIIFIMIGINDLIRGESPDLVISNIRRIIRYLNHTHPQAQIVVQSILPHGGEKSAWEGRAKLLALPNSRIQDINQELALIAEDFGAYFLDLYPLFTDAQGNLNPALSTDGLHLNAQGYLVWRSALQLYTQLKLNPASAQDSAIW